MRVLCVAFLLLLLGSPALAQPVSPAFSVHSGAMKLMDDGYAPFVEAQVWAPVHADVISFGLSGSFTAWHGLSEVVCVAGPCPPHKHHYQDAALSFRVGVSPRRVPVRFFAGVSQHFLRETRSDQTNHYPAAELGLDARVRLFGAFYASGGVLVFRGFDKYRPLSATPHAFRLGLQYRR